jgi:phosphate transport system permease protein
VTPSGIVLAVQAIAELPAATPVRPRSKSRKFAADKAIKLYFGGNAFVAILVLALITIFLFREGFGFFGQNLKNLRLYRQAGLEYVDIIRAEAEKHAALSRALNDLRQRQALASAEDNIPAVQIAADLAAFDRFSTVFSESGENVNGLVSDLTDQASALKELLTVRTELAEQKAALEKRGAYAAAAKISLPEVDRPGALAKIREGTPAFENISSTMSAKIGELLASVPRFSDPQTQKLFEKWQTRARIYRESLPAALKKLHAWSPDRPVPWYRSITSFLFGREWITASFWQDWYGIVPLLVGSIMVAIVALFFAVPFGVASAIYVSEVASPNEKKFIKPYIEFFSAIPSVVLGFFGIAVVGQAIRAASQSPWFSWVSFFPISERLNVFTAGALLALMAVPTIFTLSEDALRNVPRGFKEASYALGANRLQTIARVLVPASLSGIVSAVLLGLGRVIGETMVVLLCAGNRIAIPDFTQEFGAFFQPVHTMTGIIAQEMGEVVRGSVHYRALFMVGLVLFTLTLGINYLAQKLVARYRMSIG